MPTSISQNRLCYLFLVLLECIIYGSSLRDLLKYNSCLCLPDWIVINSKITHFSYLMHSEIREHNSHIVFYPDHQTCVPFITSSDDLNVISNLEMFAQFMSWKLQDVLRIEKKNSSFSNNYMTISNKNHHCSV